MAILGPPKRNLNRSLSLAKRTGDVTTQARCLTYLTVVSRKRGQVDEASGRAAQSLDAAAAAHMPEYAATAQANLAWAAWREGRHDECESRAGAALSDGGVGLPTGHASAAFQWTALWPLIGVCLAQGRTAEAVRRTPRRSLDPALMRMPPPIEHDLSEALACWERDDRAQTTALLRRSARRSPPDWLDLEEVNMEFARCTEFATEHPICFLATEDGDQARVRALSCGSPTSGASTS